MKRFTLTSLFFMLVGLASAYDAQIGGIYYNLNSETKQAEVTYESLPNNSYTSNVTIPATVTYNGVTYSVMTIGYAAFALCSGLTAVTIPSSVTSIDGYAFYGCSGLASIEIPNSVTYIGGEAFTGTAWYNNQPDGLLYAGKVAYKYKGTMPENSFILIKEGTATIAEKAFYNCSGLTSIQFPNSVEYIGDDAFTGTVWDNNLPDGLLYAGKVVYRYVGTMPENTSISIKEGTVTIVSKAFLGCSGLISITIPNSVTSIGDRTFGGCSSLTSVTLPNKVKLIGNMTFSYCSGLTTVTIPNGVISIGDQAFFECKDLSSINIPNSVTSIGTQTFYKCSNLTSIIIPNNVKKIGAGAFLGCSNLASVNIPNSLTAIESSTFDRCSSLTSVTIPNSVTTIGNYAFWGCRGLTEVTIPNSVTSMGNYAFSNCSGLTSVTIGSSVVFIGECAFSCCSSLKSVSCKATSVPSTESNAFHDVPLSSVSLYVPEVSVGVYQTTEPWSEFGKILTLDGGEPDPDGIESPLAEGKEGSVFNIAGQRVSKPTKGLYIVNGKKILKN
ncbi:MAG: leucine-rich repeat domain-containing protein [Bacteroidaceae bacterium]|nr:leucine-rich repeat domain-containing protein [Bacteroidaceae bacterium]